MYLVDVARGEVVVDLIVHNNLLGNQSLKVRQTTEFLASQIVLLKVFGVS